HDITERKRAENIIERRLTLEKAISTISSRFIDVVDIDAAIEATLADIGRLTGAERAYLFLLRTGSRTTERTYEWCADGIRPLKDKLVGISIDRSPWWRRELRHNRAVYVKDFSALPPEAKAQTLGLGIDKIRSLLLLPMSVAGEVRGLMGFDNAGRTKDWNDDDLSLMRTCSEIVGLALNRRQAEDALRESEAKYSTLVEQAEDGVLIVQDGVCVFANTAASKAMGYAPEGLHGKPFLDLAAPDSRQAAAERYAAWQAGNQVTNPFELRVIAHDGSVRETEAHTATIQYRGRPALMAVARDVTGRKRALAALQESERRYRLLAENASDVIWIVDGKLQFTYISPSVTRLRGFSVEEAAAQTFEQMIAPSSLATIMALVAEDRPAGETESREGNDTVSPETELTCKDGSTIWTENRVTLLHDSDGRVTGYLGASRDITQRKRAQDALRESEAKYSALVEQAKDAVFILQDHICQFSNNAVEKISGYHVDELQGKPYLHLLSPRSRDLIVQRNQLRELSQEVPSVLEVEVICKDGTLKPVEVSAGIIRYGGRPAHMAIVRDITERKRAERALRDSERRYRLLAENISDAIWVMDTRLRFTYVSPSVTRLLSYSVEEALPKTIHDLVAPGSLGVVLEAVARERAQQQAEKEPQYRAETLELEMRRRDGTTVWTENNVGLVRDADGSVTGYLGVSRDVTERRRAQQALRDGEETMRSLIENSPDIIATVGQDGIIQYANRSVAGITVEDVVGKTPYEFLLPAYHEPFRARMAKTFETGRGEPLETEGLGPNGIVARYETRFGSIRRGEHIAAITMIISDITERKRAERERVEHAMALARAEELQISRRRIVMAQETVRRDIAQKLHGSVQNRLIVLLHNLTEMEHSASSDRLSAQLRELHQRLKEVLDDHIRPISRRLYPSILRQGLVPALQSLGDQFESVLPIEMKLDSELVEEERINRKLVPEQVRLAAYRIAEEALANAAKHAKPYRVDVALERLPDGKLRLTVQDNGQGFAIETVPAGLGILMMQDYAEVAGGTCVVHSAPGEGTSVMTVFALEEPG
ncbi:MAG: PAS domain S-box protein, partial [Chloroflexi bacterium]|nr:PAS domain S-box protein [Chloroflexota bacterium]